MINKHNQLIDELIAAGSSISSMGLTWGSSGNLSARTEDGRMLITSSGMQLKALNNDSFSLFNLQTEQHEGKKPSKEAPIHAAIYRQVPWASAVLHASPPLTTLAACSNLVIPQGLFVENMYYLQRIVRIPYAHPGSAALLQSVSEAAHCTNVMLLSNHGVLIYDTCIAECLIALEVLENTCRMALLSAEAGLTLSTLAPETQQDFLMNSGYKPLRPWINGHQPPAIQPVSPTVHPA